MICTRMCRGVLCDATLAANGTLRRVKRNGSAECGIRRGDHKRNKNKSIIGTSAGRLGEDGVETEKVAFRKKNPIIWTDLIGINCGKAPDTCPCIGDEINNSGRPSARRGSG
ncbi:hypothetical protein EVAR_57839_1 [Eumeta japonica]|uniref:Uncharacterized protein n=1 Tax=Eumeta variegata TaxID=151549 RepID=A0A4C1YVF0_EUMVA|nr:hypothetical protein EVAR_57839_1 [Eumeta japonica]